LLKTHAHSSPQTRNAELSHTPELSQRKHRDSSSSSSAFLSTVCSGFGKSISTHRIKININPPENQNQPTGNQNQNQSTGNQIQNQTHRISKSKSTHRKSKSESNPPEIKIKFNPPEIKIKIKPTGNQNQPTVNLLCRRPMPHGFHRNTRNFP
jgi:hypothetical protein